MERQQERVLRWLEEEDEDDVFGGEDEGAVYPDEKVNKHNTDSEQECDDNDLATTSSDHQQASESSNNQHMDVNSSDSDDNFPLINMALQNFCCQKEKQKWKLSNDLQLKKGAVSTRCQNKETEYSYRAIGPPRCSSGDESSLTIMASFF
ncbi:hypothetical protein EVAR_30765_1 [Eumeta japonica]|uniref:Uncharacterized protein n=1 Tax=Eumeta variegata TaxID=151549 RepID=A0A4C1V7A9_EUMVA|nr:hypothetical protein EVAR_30765_1 [Eumeta japonica]